ncbi:hypothetical protein PSHT_05793 [Puccinia striiformis]|uniref:Uncharacterized protein n=1 Tax=Puccinia striiformis TaxID=27350 RepID=A0A2S4W9M2_9BASI|nr:hypothetical protein PSHT_05793 [Puccinia striiformis]
MTRHRTLSTSDLLPLFDPEAIIRAANAARRHLTQPICRTQTSSMSDSPGNTTNIPHLPDDSYRANLLPLSDPEAVIRAANAARRHLTQPIRRTQTSSMSDSPGNTTNIPHLPDNSYRDLVMALALKSDEPAPTGRSNNAELDLQRFRTSDGPKFTGPFMEVEPFVRWINSLQIFFTTKNVILAADKIKVVGSLFDESNILRFYANESSKYLTGSWESFKTQITRARTLQSSANFDATEAASLDDFDLAQFVIFGLPQSLQDRITELEIMNKAPFEYSWFEQRVGASFNASRGTTTTTAPTRSTSATLSTSRDDFIWRVHAWLDLRGECHFCKKTCGNAAGACPGPINKKYLPIPDSFVTPPKPVNYSPPRAWSSPSSAPGRPTNPPAGRPSTRAATVAGVAEEDQFDTAALASVQEALAKDGLFDYAFEDTEGCYGHLDAAAIAGLEEMHVQRWKNEDEKAEEDAKDWAENFADEVATS